MGELKLGEQLVLEVREGCCCDCFFYHSEHPICRIVKCGNDERKDGKSVIFVEKKGNKQ